MRKKPPQLLGLGIFLFFVSLAPGSMCFFTFQLTCIDFDYFYSVAAIVPAKRSIGCVCLIFPRSTGPSNNNAFSRRLTRAVQFGKKANKLRKLGL